MRATRVLLLAALLPSCANIGRDPYYGARPPPDAEIVVRQPELYTRGEIDAINAEIQCRTLARNSLEAQRCGIRR